MRRPPSSGYTAGEVIFTCAVIAFVAALCYTLVLRVQASARDDERISELTTLQIALARYYSDHGQYPISNCISTPSWNCWGASGESKLLPSAYAASLPQDPRYHDDGTACAQGDKGSFLYGYYSDNGQRYVLATHLERPRAGDRQTGELPPEGCLGFANWAIRTGF